MGRKGELRAVLRERLEGLPPEAFRAAGLGAAALIERQPLWGPCRTVLLFLSLDREPDTRPLMEAAFAGGKPVFVPRTAGKGLRFWRAASPGGPWEPGPFGIREPPARPGAELTRADFPALVITPGLGFDRRGGRLGRGGGYYDRFFAALAAPAPSAPEGAGGTAPLACFALGLCVPAQLEAEIPADIRDKRMDAVCTGEEFFYTGAYAAPPEPGLRLPFLLPIH